MSNAVKIDILTALLIDTLKTY